MFWCLGEFRVGIVEDYLSEVSMESSKGKPESGNCTNTGEEVKGCYTYDYPRPALTADNVVFGFDGEHLNVLLVKRGTEPYLGLWALPGGFMRMCESIDECARRELYEETNVRDIYLKQIHTFSSPERDPRGRVVTVAFMALVRPSDHKVIGGDDASEADWFDVERLPELAFDHHEILEYARMFLRESLRLRPVAFRLINEVFTVDELRKVYEVINDTVYDRRNFERKLLSAGIVDDMTPPAEPGRRPLRRFSLNSKMTRLLDKDSCDDHPFIDEGSLEESLISAAAPISPGSTQVFEVYDEIPTPCSSNESDNESDMILESGCECSAHTELRMEKLNDDSVYCLSKDKTCKKSKGSDFFGSIKNLFDFFD